MQSWAFTIMIAGGRGGCQRWSSVRTKPRFRHFRPSLGTLVWVNRIDRCAAPSIQAGSFHLSNELVRSLACTRIPRSASELHRRRFRVLNKCANPACAALFRKLSQGKLFLVETEPLAGPALRRARWKGQSSHFIEHYWLCDECAFTLTLSYEKGRGVVAVLRPDPAKKKRPAAAALAGDVQAIEGRRGEQSA